MENKNKEADRCPSCSTYLIQGHRRAGAYSSFPRVKDRLHPGQVTSERKDSSFLHVQFAYNPSGTTSGPVS